MIHPDENYIETLKNKWKFLIHDELEVESSAVSKLMIAYILENQSKWLQDFTESDTYKYLSTFRPSYFINSWISVQPMTQPLGGIAFYRPYIKNTLSDLPKQAITDDSRLSPYERMMKAEASKQLVSVSPAVEIKNEVKQTRSLLAPDCIACGGDGKHKLGCPKKNV